MSGNHRSRSFRKDRQKSNNLVLIGFMGSGKTSLGMRLSYMLRMAVEDTDKMIEQIEKREIKQIFAEDGEEYFRDCETGLLKSLTTRKSPRIYSLGGGTPLREENRPLIKKAGKVVYLRIQPETVYERLRGDSTRPLLQCENPLEKIRELLSVRDGIYAECADLIIDVDHINQSEIAEKIVHFYKTFSKQNETTEKISEESETPSNTENKTKILVINGPNLNFLGIRDKAIYGTKDYAYLVRIIEEKAQADGFEVECYQSNHEGAIIDRLQAAYFDGTAGIVINPGAYTHYSYAIRDALEPLSMPKIEVHISDINSRDEFRHISVTEANCDGQIVGHGLEGYLEAIDLILKKG